MYFGMCGFLFCGENSKIMVLLYFGVETAHGKKVILT